MDDISIDRLVLEIPGLTGESAAGLAHKIGAQLATAETGAGEFQQLSVTLDDDSVNAKDAGHERLATSIVAALLRQIG
jgi:hypothetical protein